MVLVPAWWNMLTVEIRALWSLLQFHRACEADLFHQAFGHHIAEVSPALQSLHSTTYIFRYFILPEGPTAIAPGHCLQF